MLPVFGRPLRAKRDTQSSEHGLVATKEHHHLTQAAAAWNGKYGSWVIQMR